MYINISTNDKKPPVRMYTKEELIRLCKSAYITGTRVNDLTFDEWQKKNIK
jgi:hypothetical protein